MGELQAYDGVVPFSNSPFADADTLGNNLADYVDGGGVVVQTGFSFYGPGQPFGINGRWVTGNYNPYDYSTNLVFGAFTLGAHNPGHPLMAGVTTLNSDFQNVVTLAPGATQVAAASNGNSLIAYRPVGAHTSVGITAYLGAAAAQSGDWGRVVVNAVNWLCGPAATATSATATATTATSASAATSATATSASATTATTTAAHLRLHLHRHRLHHHRLHRLRLRLRHHRLRLRLRRHRRRHLRHLRLAAACRG